MVTLASVKSVSVVFGYNAVDAKTADISVDWCVEAAEIMMAKRSGAR